MQALLMNFGTQTRVIHDINKTPRVIEIGQTKEIELDPHTAKFIEQSQKTDTLMMIALDGEMPKELADIASILKDMDDVSYEVILTRTVMLIGKENVPSLRPTRPELRICLREVAMQFAHGGIKTLPEAIAAMAERRRIKDDQDPGKLEQEHREAEEAKQNSQQHPVKKASMRDRISASLGLDDEPLSGSALANDIAAGGEAGKQTEGPKEPAPKKPKVKTRKKPTGEFKPKAGPPPIKSKRAVQRVRL